MAAVTVRPRPREKRMRSRDRGLRDMLNAQGLLSEKETADLLGRPVARLRKMLTRGEVPFVLVEWRGTQVRAVPARAVGQ